MSHLITSGRYAGLIAKSNNTTRTAGGVVGVGPGLVITGGAGTIDLIHQIPVGRSFYVTKIMWYQVTGANVTLVFGTLGGAGGIVLVPMFPTQLALNGMPGELLEEELTGVEFMLNSQAIPIGWNGSLYVTSSVAAVQISCEVAEKA